MYLGLYGAGNMGRMILLAARESRKWDDIFFIVDEQFLKEKAVAGCMVYCLDNAIAIYGKDNIEILICSGEPSVRKTLFDKVKERGLKLGTFIDPSVKVHECTKIEEGVIILQGCIINWGVTIKCNSVLFFGVILGENNTVMEHCYLAPGVNTAGDVTWGECSFGGIECTVRQHTVIGKYAIVGQGAVVIRDVPDYTTVAGNPARQLGESAFRKVFE